MSLLFGIFLFLGIAVILVKQTGIKKGSIEENSKEARILDRVGGVLIGAIFPIYTYNITDTLWEWLVITLVLLVVLGCARLMGLAIEKLKHCWWAIPLAGTMFLGASYIMTIFSISEDSKALGIGMLAMLFCSTEQGTKKRGKNRKLLLAEAIGVFLLVLLGGDYISPQTKPMRMANEAIADIRGDYTSVIVSEGIDSPKRGKHASITVFLEGENKSLKEIRYYDYFRGNLTLESREQFSNENKENKVNEDIE